MHIFTEIFNKIAFENSIRVDFAKKYVANCKVLTPF